MERGKTIQQAMRKVFREVREEYRTKEQNTIAHPLVDKCVEVGKTNHFNSTINSVLIYLCGIHLAHQMDPFFTPQNICLLYTSPSPRDRQKSRMPSSA